MYNILFCSCGRRCKLLKNFKDTLGDNVKIVATDNQIYAPALHFADKQYIVPKIYDNNYMDTIVNICQKENIQAIMTFIDPEISLLAENKKTFDNMGILMLTPDKNTAEICFDKYKMYKFLRDNNIDTQLTYENIDDFDVAYKNGEIDFPVFVKPRTGSGSVGARKINNYNDLIDAFLHDDTLIVQELMQCIDMDTDVYIDAISHEVVAVFGKKKIETKIGGASKTISFKDERILEIIKKLNSLLNFNGTIDIDFFYKDGKYYVSEINPRFGGAYLHAYGLGVNFIPYIINNINKVANSYVGLNYEEDVIMMMYDDVVIIKKSELEKYEKV